jgi:hypothetical protein
MLAMCLDLCGCSIALRHDPLVPPRQRFNDTVRTARQAEGIDREVGWGRFTIFYIPVVPVYIDGDGNQEIMDQVRDALRQVGYSVVVADPPTLESDDLVLTCRIKDFWFNNFTALFPPLLIPTWGEIRLEAALSSRNGSTVWSHEFEGSGFSINYLNGYTSAAGEAMTEILNHMVQVFSSDEFRSALGATLTRSNPG